MANTTMYIASEKVIVSGENSFIKLGDAPEGPFSTHASLWHITFSPFGPGHVLYLRSELLDDQWMVYTDNIAMARWMQRTVQGMLNPALKDETIPYKDATFTRNGDVRDFWRERVITDEGEIVLTWHNIGEPLHLNMPPYVSPERHYGVSTVLIPALSSHVTINGKAAKGKTFATQREGRPYSTSCLAFAESWTVPGDSR